MKRRCVYLAEIDTGHGDWDVIGVFSSLEKAMNAFDKTPGYVWKKTSQTLWNYGNKNHPEFGNECVTKHEVE